ncbi:formate dehydrogenase subunit gamma [Sphingobium sp. TA15]|uniref:NAD-dependent formate dehydrogenase gamma subunit n=1 Tax=Sphingobium indicum (strain DSM 16413 / CCM 7287 / MTCC 6362 / UT26 / NBRC 101211 / UT26S) TaxID=452662 RepID=D4Z7Q5_SPHIU|nr:NADH-quinone oxidoreductase subunit E [Sphingobium indicum]BAI98524.1 NAD-dependent formate dehydrogenase gamma subunit [Sphingobium indicum UT26S]BDD68579.1 formate dehydrogenase subunit gamma [Sphingobium sp. TA15]
MQQEETARLIEDWTQTHGRTRDRLLPLLHMLQEEIGFIDGNAIKIIAEKLNLTRADVHGVVTFYHDFRRAPAGRHVVKLCRAESCQARGAAAMEKAAAERLGVPMGETRPDGQVTLEPIYCLGLCAVGPNALVDGRPVARIDAAALDRIAQEVAA